ncbi:MAG: hypothetical protein ACT4OP_10775 [Actinomycetota bacterium]
MDADLAELAIGELRLAAAGKPTVCVYLFEMIAAVTEAVTGNGRDKDLRHQAALLLRAVEGQDLPAHDLTRIRQAYTARFGDAFPRRATL